MTDRERATIARLADGLARLLGDAPDDATMPLVILTSDHVAAAREAERLLAGLRLRGTSGVTS